MSIRELYDDSQAVLRRVREGQTLLVTVDGEPVAELRPLPAQGTPVPDLLAAWRHLPPTDPAQLRADIDAAIDTRLFPD